MEVAKLAAPPNLEVRFVSCNESAIKRWLISELEETVFSLTHELFMTKHHTVTLRMNSIKQYSKHFFFFWSQWLKALSADFYQIERVSTSKLFCQALLPHTQ